MNAPTAERLAAMDAGQSMPFTLTLSLTGFEQPQSFHCQTVLRVLPGRRQVMACRWSGEHVVLKLFTGKDRLRYLDRERRGLNALAAAGVPIAEMRAVVADVGVVGLVLQYLPEARPVRADEQTRLEEVAALLGRMHAAGIWHADLHLDNFQVTKGRIHAIDGDGVRHRGRPLSASAGRRNLVVLAAQRPPRLDAGLMGLGDAYARGRGTPAEPLATLQAALSQARRARILRYLKKAQRDCTEFAVTHTFRARTFAVRGPGEAAVEMLLRDPDGIMESGALLKAGNSATIVRATDSGLIYKRFNIKSIRHGLRRMLRPLPRFRRAWLGGQLLHFLEIPTARPLALVERHLGPWRGVAYLVMENAGTLDLASEVARNGLSEARCAEVTALFGLLKQVGLSHGDAKASNFLIDEDQLQLIDLDGLRLNPKGLARDLERFLSNWQPAEQDRFRASFRSAGLI